MTIQRVFVALPVEPADAGLLASRLPGFEDPGIKTVAWQNYHVTLAFIGSISTGCLKNLGKRLPVLANHLPQTLDIEAAAPFPKRSSGMLVALIKPTDSLMKLERAVTGVLDDAAVGFDRRERFRPHITLARTGRRQGPGTFAEISLDLRFVVSRLGIYRGEMTGSGYRYQSLFSIERRAGSSSG